MTQIIMISADMSNQFRSTTQCSIIPVADLSPTGSYMVGSSPALEPIQAGRIEALICVLS